MKKNRMMRLASILLVCVLLSTSVISGTYAKYISTASGSDTARVAKWDITVEGEKLGVENQTVTFNLFDCADANVLKDSTGKNVDAKGMKLIAPGTEGSFTFDITNHSEVNAKYTIDLTETNNGAVPLQYKLDGSGWVDSIDELSLENRAIAMTDGVASHTVYWRWVFEGTTEGAHAGQTDEFDTALGVYARDHAGEPVVTIGALITVEQVD